MPTTGNAVQAVIPSHAGLVVPGVQCSSTGQSHLQSVSETHMALRQGLGALVGARATVPAVSWWAVPSLVFILPARGAAKGCTARRLAPAHPSLAKTPACDEMGRLLRKRRTWKEPAGHLLCGVEAVPYECPVLKAISLIAFVVSENKLNHPSVSGQKNVGNIV